MSSVKNAQDHSLDSCYWWTLQGMFYRKNTWSYIHVLVYFSCIVWYSFRWGWTHMFMSLAGGVMVFIAVCLWTTVQQDRVWRETSCCYTNILYYRKHLSFFGFANFVCQASDITTRHTPSSHNFKRCSHSLCWTWGPNPLNQRCSALLQRYTPS